MTLQGKIEHVALTDPGRVREHNEDAIGYDIDLGLFVLADGMGGYNAGEVASSIAVKTTVDLVQGTLPAERRGEIDAETGLMLQSVALRDAVRRANKIIHQTARSQEECAGMGTTIVSCLMYDNRLSVAHVGDSRLYRVRQNRFEQLTQDHSLLQELVDRGVVERDEAERKLKRNYVTRALGVEPEIEVAIMEVDALPGDIFVLCSDGLSDMVEDDDIHLTISTFHTDLSMVGRQLIQLTNDNGGRDNVSVLMVRVLKPFPANRGLLSKVVNWFG
ncbi:MAG: Stp1/IreP family PP2C-type Ser/Thr phosphatase [Pseudomonadota bacterium]